MTSPILQAALSHYQAKRDKSISDLYICLNYPDQLSGSVNVTEEVIRLFAILENSDSIISTINEIIVGNSKRSAEHDFAKIKQEVRQAIADLSTEEKNIQPEQSQS